MVFGITIAPPRFRYDSQLFPLVAVTDRPAESRLKIADWHYLPITLDDFTLRFPNRTMESTPVVARTMTNPAWTHSSGVSTIATDGIHKTATEGNSGSYFNTALSIAKCSIEARATSTELTAGISLQNGTATIVHDYEDEDAIHAILLGPRGLGEIRELGVPVARNATFRYESGDLVMIELDGGIVRYYLVKPDSRMILLRATRSKLTAAPKAEVLVYFVGSQLDDVWLHDNSEVSTLIDLYGALENHQDWFNDFAHMSTADSIQMANNQPVFTFANSKTRLRSLAASLNVRVKADRDDYLDFFDWHGIEKDFLFVDIAHKDRDNNQTEFWAQFASPWADKARGSCLSAHQAQITESYKTDVIVKEFDVDAPTVTLVDPAGAPFTEAFEIEGSWTDIGTGRVKEFQIYIDGQHFGTMIQNTELLSNALAVPVDPSSLAHAVHDLYIIAYDWGGNSDQSNTVTFTYDAGFLFGGGEALLGGGEELTV